MTGKNPSPGNNDKLRKGQAIKTRYGAGQQAEINSEAEETQRQEYDAKGLPRTQQYTVDKTAQHKADDKKRSRRTDTSDYGA